MVLPVHSVAPDLTHRYQGKRCVSGAHDAQIFLWDLHELTLSTEPNIHFIGHTAAVTAIVITRDMQTMISADRRGNLSRGAFAIALSASVKHSYFGHALTIVYDRSVCFEQTDTVLLTAV